MAYGGDYVHDAGLPDSLPGWDAGTGEYEWYPAVPLGEPSVLAELLHRAREHAPLGGYHDNVARLVGPSREVELWEPVLRYDLLDSFQALEELNELLRVVL